MGTERKYSEIISCFIFIPQAYYLKQFKAKTKMILHTEAKPKFTLLNNFNNMFNEGMLWSMGIAFRKDKNTSYWQIDVFIKCYGKTKGEPPF